MRKYFISPVLIAVFFCLYCVAPSVQSTTTARGVTEEDAVKKVAEDICLKQEMLKGKKLAVFTFSNLEGKETTEGARLSKKLIGELIKKGLILVERTEIDRILKEQGFQQTGIVDTESLSVTGKILPIEVMINGTIAQISIKGELSVKAVDMSTGQIYAAATVEFLPLEGFSYKENPEKLKLFKRDPDKLETMNSTFTALTMLSQKYPLLFILASLDESEIPRIKETNPQLGMKLKEISQRMRAEKQGNWRKIMKLRRGTQFMKEFAPEQYQKILEIKKDLIRGKLAK